MSHGDVARYPLSWPTGWKRTRAADRRVATFAKHITVAATEKTLKYTRQEQLTAVDAAQRLDREIERLGGLDPILSTNLRLRLDGIPTAKQTEPSDPGASVFFSLHKKPMCLACDKWDRVADNIAALAQHIDALRRIDRYGVGSMEQAFAGYAALPPTSEDWAIVLGISKSASVADVETAFKALARKHHPDVGGTHDMMAKLTEARRLALASITQRT